jgi:hypothetical protein
MLHDLQEWFWNGSVTHIAGVVAAVVSALIAFASSARMYKSAIRDSDVSINIRKETDQFMRGARNNYIEKLKGVLEKEAHK